MTKATIVTTMGAVLLAGSASMAQAQGQAPEMNGFITLYGGAQPQQRTLETISSFPLYEETATVKSTQPVHNGPVFGITGGYRVRPHLGVAVGVSMFQARTSDGTVVASIPDPVFFDRPANVTRTTSGLKHSDLGVHFQAVWFHPISPELEISLAAGPSLFHVKQDLVSSVTVAPGTQNITVVLETQSKNALGFNAGFEGNYLIKPSLGVGLFVRYVGATVDLPSAEDLKVGGVQGGLGLRVRF